MTNDLTELLSMPAGPVSDRHPAIALGHRESTDEGLSAASHDAALAIAELADLPIVCVENGAVQIVRDDADLPWVPSDALAAVVESLPSRAGESVEVHSSIEVDVCATRLASGAIAVTTLPKRHGQPVPVEATLQAAELGWTSERVMTWWRRHPVHSPGTAKRLIDLSVKAHSANEQTAQYEWELESLADQIDSTFEEITLLHYLAQNLQETHDTAELARLCLQRIGDSLHAAGGAVWLQVGEGNAHFLPEGDVPFDELGLAQLIGSFGAHPWPQPLVMNHVQSKNPTAAMHGLDSFVVVPIHAGKRQVGWLTCLNSAGDTEFGTVEASLLASVAVTLGTHVQNAEDVRDREEMLLSFVRSFVSSLDAKDPYTRGHSERVARIAAALARQLGDSDEDVETIHLCGLLHDVGKIGIDDAVLGKPGHLTDEEFEQIKRHPTIGYHILSGIRSLSHILPGVRNHHESWDGSGYPDGFATTDIPRQARILAVADSYDAMTSDRPYRNGMPLEKLQQIFTEERGKQWDPEIIDAYFEIADEIVQICDEWKRQQ